MTNESITDLIEGSAKLMSACHGWPSFAGASIVYLRLDRPGPTVTVAMELKSLPGRPEGDTVNVTLRGFEVKGLEIAGIDPNLSLDGIVFMDVLDGVEVRFRSADGLRGRIVARRMAILDVVVISD